MLFESIEIWHTHDVWSIDVHKVNKNLLSPFCLIKFNFKLRSVSNHVFLASSRKSTEATSELKQLPVRHLFTII